MKLSSIKYNTCRSNRLGTVSDLVGATLESNVFAMEDIKALWCSVTGGL
ncbi:MAG: hypothetical protein H0U18_09525 [Pyrinomonadaceae bacterium]|nr:hypothetical protein [Pyrinomonadaceae bacterium]